MLHEQWRSRGETLEIHGRKVFYVDSAQESGARKPRETLVILHGFPTSSQDFYKVWPLLTEKFRVIIHDHLGFGFSDKPADYSYSLVEQAETALELWRRLGIGEAHLLAHDYGTSVATEITARRERGHEPVRLKSLTLCNGSVHIELADLRVLQVLLRNKTLGPLVARLSSRRVFGLQMKRIWGDSDKLPVEEIDAMWACITNNDGKAAMPRISQYLHERVRFKNRWIGSLQRLDIPAHVLWAQKDPVSLPTIGRRLKVDMPHAEYTELPEPGHYPMLEDPEGWAAAALNFLNDQARAKSPGKKSRAPNKAGRSKTGQTGSTKKKARGKSK